MRHDARPTSGRAPGATALALLCLLPAPLAAADVGDDLVKRASPTSSPAAGTATLGPSRLDEP